MWSRARILLRHSRILPQAKLQGVTSLSTGTKLFKLFFDRNSQVVTIGSGLSVVSLGLTFPSFLGFGKKEGEEDAVVMLMKRAKLSQIREDYVAAEKYYHDALAELNKKKGKSELTDKEFLYAIININDCLAELALVQGNLEMSVTLFKEVMKGCLESGIDTDDNAIIEISIKIATVFAMQHKNDEARQGFLHCIKTQEKKMKGLESPDENTKALLGLALDSYSRFLLMQKEYKAAEESLTRSYDIAVDVLGPEHNQTLIILNSLATVNIMRKNYEKAEKTAKKAIEIGEKTRSQDIAAFHCNLGAIYLRQGRYEEATKTCVQAKKLSSKTKDKVSKSQAEKCLQKLREVQQKKAAQSSL